ncbi:MAG: NAD-dependent deacylase [Bacteroidetes bacterium]|nr:NAD-dependent deacylase [Bacteroidota bacterium]
MPKPTLVVLTGAGMSAESGIKTFRDAGGLWEGHDVMQVASPEGFAQNPELVLEFYNQRRRQLAEVEPNACHLFLAEIEDHFNVQIITQNVDNLHERAGSTHVLHLHGELTKAESIGNPNYIKDIGYEDLSIGHNCPDGYQLRPHIVWFGEQVPKMEPAIELSTKADYFVVIGTSLQVYPAASLTQYAPQNAAKLLIDPKAHEMYASGGFKKVGSTAVEGISALKKFLNL